MNRVRLRQVDIRLADWHDHIKKKIQKLEKKHFEVRLAKYKCMDTIINHNNDIKSISSIVVPDIIDYVECIVPYEKRKIFDDAINHKCMMLVEYKYKQIIKKQVYNELDRLIMDYDYYLFTLH